MKEKTKIIIIAVIVNIALVACSIFGTYTIVAPKVIRTGGELKLFYDNPYNNFVSVTGNVPTCEDIVVAVPTTTGEFLNGIGITYDYVVGDDYDNSDSIVWTDNVDFLKTPYESSHWALGYTEEKVPVVFKYSTDTYIDTKWNRRATCSDLFHDFYGDDKYFIISGDLYKSNVNVKYIGQKFNGDISKITTFSEIEKNSTVDNYLAEGRDIPCVFVYCDLIYN